MNDEGWLNTTTEPADRGFRYVFTRLQGGRLIPQWFMNLIKPGLLEGGKVTCKNCGWKDDCVLRLSFTMHKRQGTLTEEVKRELQLMCSNTKGTKKEIRRTIK